VVGKTRIKQLSPSLLLIYGSVTREATHTTPIRIKFSATGLLDRLAKNLVPQSKSDMKIVACSDAWMADAFVGKLGEWAFFGI